MTVSGQAPIVDVRSSGAQTQFERETHRVAAGHGPSGAAQRDHPRGEPDLVGRAQRRRNDRTQTRFSVHGAPEAQPVMDGINQQIPGITIGVFVFSQLNIQEVVAGVRRRRRGRLRRHAAEDGAEGRRQYVLWHGDVYPLRFLDGSQQRQRRAACPEHQSGSARVAQEVPGDRPGAWRSDQAGQGVVLRVGSRGGEPAVCGRRAVEQADAAAVAPVRAGFRPSRQHERLHQGPHRALDLAGCGEAQVRRRHVAAAQLQLPVQSADDRHAPHT